MKHLTVLVPSRGRPQNIARLQAAWSQTTTHGARLVTLVDLDDPTLPQYQNLHSERFPVYAGPRKRFIGTLNCAAQNWARTSTAMGSIGDDHLPRTKGWDKTILDTLAQNPGICYGDDLFRGPDLPTAAFLSAELVTAWGYMAPPEMVHLYCDDFWRDLGRAAGCLTYLPQVVIEHLHPHAGKAENDELYTDANNAAAFEADRLAYEKYRATRFDQDVQLARDTVSSIQARSW